MCPKCIKMALKSIVSITKQKHLLNLVANGKKNIDLTRLNIFLKHVVTFLSVCFLKEFFFLIINLMNQCIIIVSKPTK